MEISRKEHRELQKALKSDLAIPRQLASHYEQHLQHCRTCRRILSDSGRLREELKDLGPS